MNIFVYQTHSFKSKIIPKLTVPKYILSEIHYTITMEKGAEVMPQPQFYGKFFDKCEWIKK